MLRTQLFNCEDFSAHDRPCSAEQIAVSAWLAKQEDGIALTRAIRQSRDLKRVLAMADAPPTAAQQAQQAAQANAMARAAILARSLDMKQQIYQNTIATPGSTANVVNIVPRNVGLIKGFLIKMTANILNNDATHAINLTNFGPANLLSQILYNDLNNNTRVQDSGWHLNLIDSVKRRRVYGSAVTTDTPLGYAKAWNVISAPASIAGAGNGNITMYFYIPLAYADNDLRGAIYANVIQATQQLQLTINPNIGAAPTGDPTLAVYQLATGGVTLPTITTTTITVYQLYLDQLPQGNGSVVLPLQDLSWAYELKNTVGLNAVVVSQDNPISYSNYRQFLSTAAFFDNWNPAGPSYGAAGVPGDDVNYWALQTANFTNIWKLDPLTLGLQHRAVLWDDTPIELYYFDTRVQPVNTIQYGNMQLVLNPSTVRANATVLMGYEDFALLNTVTGAGSLA